jgi:threonine/homoserine/homoserine lactone efflux protein
MAGPPYGWSAKYRMPVPLIVLPVLSPAIAGLGLGLALAGSPGPVQALLLTESVSGGMRRGFRVMAAANLTFGVLLVAIALGVAVALPSGIMLRILKVVGGAFLLYLGIDGVRARPLADARSSPRPGLPATARGVLAVILNPGAWLFLATAAASFLSTEAHAAGRAGAVLAALTLLAGLVIGDGSVVLLAGLGIRRAGEWRAALVRRALALILAALGLALLISGLVP